MNALIEKRMKKNRVHLEDIVVDQLQKKIISSTQKINKKSKKKKKNHIFGKKKSCIVRAACARHVLAMGKKSSD